MTAWFVCSGVLDPSPPVAKSQLAPNSSEIRGFQLNLTKTKTNFFFFKTALEFLHGKPEWQCTVILTLHWFAQVTNGNAFMRYLLNFCPRKTFLYCPGKNASQNLNNCLTITGLIIGRFSLFLLWELGFIVWQQQKSPSKSQAAAVGIQAVQNSPENYWTPPCRACRIKTLHNFAPLS